MKVGALAQRTGLSVRALHHYDEIGLLRPAERTPSGHRLYGPREVARLKRITALRELGLPLERIGAVLDDPAYDLAQVVELQIRTVEAELEAGQRLLDGLRDLRERLASSEELPVDTLLESIAQSARFGRYFTAEQLDALARRRRDAGQGRMEEAAAEWAELFEGFGACVRRGVAPDAEEAQALGRRAQALIDEFTGGDAAIEQSLGRMYRSEGPGVASGPAGGAVPQEVWAYMAEVRKALAGPTGPGSATGS